MNLFTTITTFCQTHTLLPPDSCVIVGLSGGPDSMLLMHYLHAVRKEGKISTLIAAHLDHGWRPESHADMLFCQTAATHLSIPFVSGRLSDFVHSRDYNGSQEALGRQARRLFLQSVARHYHATHIALAHHADDQQETMLIRMIRGASVSGLSSMRPQQGLYIRPLLAASKKDIVAYLNTHDIPYLTDATNSSDQFLRNRIRNHVLPALHAVDTRAYANFTKSIQALQDTEAFLERLTHQVFTQLVVQSAPHPTIAIDAFHAVDPFLQHRLIIVWLCAARVPFTPSTGLITEIMRFLRTRKQHATHCLYDRWFITKHKYNATIISSKDNEKRTDYRAP